MAREGIRLEPNWVESVIRDEAEHQELDISQIEEQIISEIIASMPPEPNTTHLLKWCNGRVEEILKRYPAFSGEKIAMIRNEVGKELRYKIDEQRFEHIRELITIEQPETINPQWIRDHDYALSLSIRRGYKNIDGKIDWDFIFRKLGVGQAFNYRTKEEWGGDREKIIDALKNILEEKQPSTFSPDWIFNNAGKIYRQIQAMPRQNKEGVIEWDTILSQLGPEWAGRFTYVEMKKGLSFLERINELKDALEKLNPPSFGPAWIRKNCESEYNYFFNHIRQADDEGINWEVILDLLPKQWKERWAERKWDIDKAVRFLNEKLEREQPQSFNAFWIGKQSSALANFIRKTYKNATTGAVDWSPLISQLSTEWQSRWRDGMRDEFAERPDQRKYNFEGLIQELNLIFLEENPGIISPIYIYKKAPHAYNFFTRKIRNEQGIDWEKIVEGFDTEFQSRWDKMYSFEEKKPKEMYKDSIEIDQALGSLSEKLYTFYGTLDEDDIKARRQIADRLTELAQKGNELAKEKLTEHTQYMVNEYIDSNQQLVILRHLPDLVKTIIEKCIILYKHKDNGNFEKYLAAHLFHQAQKVKAIQIKGNRKLDTQVEKY